MNQEPWNFTAQPKVMKAKAKFREQESNGKEELAELPPNKYHNLMWDKRVLRGNTYATVLTDNNPVETKPNISKIQKASFQKSKEQESLPVVVQEPGTPKAIPGREHVSVETDEFVETLTDKPPFYEKEAQTDFNIEKPPIRHYLPVKTGLSKETQIWDGELFDFDYEVEPILQVLLGKTLEHSRMEVLEEEELRVMKQQQDHYAKLKREEMSEIKRLEEKERRLLEEIEKKKYENKKVLEQKIESHKKIISRVISKNFLKTIKPKTFERLENLGVFRKPFETSFFKDFLPWMCQTMQSELLFENKVETKVEEWLLEVQNASIEQNKETIAKFFKDREEKRAELLRLQKEKEERIRKRKEEKARLAEIKRRQDLKNEIMEKLVSKGDLREKLSYQLLSDIDGCEKETPYVGLFGGAIGEMILFFNSLRLMGFENVISSKKIEKNIYNCLNLLLKNGAIEFGIDEKIVPELTKLDETLNFDNILTMQIEKTDELKELLISNLGSLILQTMIQEYEFLELDNSLVVEVLTFFFKFAFEQENAKNIRLVKMTRPSNLKRKALCHVFPLLEELPFAEEIIEKKEKEAKEKGGKETARSKDSEKKLQNEISLNESAEKENKVENLTDAEIEEKFTVFPAIYEDFKVLIVHKVAQEIMRRDFIDELKIENVELLGHEYEILRKLDERFLQFEEKIVDKVAKGIDVFHIEMY